MKTSCRLAAFALTALWSMGTVSVSSSRYVQSGTETVGGFADAVVQSLERFRPAASAMKPLTPEQYDLPLEQRIKVGKPQVQELMRQIHDAPEPLGRYLRSSDTAIRIAAEGLQGAYRRIETSHAAVLDALLPFAKIQDAQSLADAQKEQIMGLMENGEKSWKELPLAMEDVNFALQDQSRKVGGRVSYLRITQAERTRLLARLEKLESDERVVEYQFSAAVSTMNRFLKQDWKSADEK